MTNNYRDYRFEYLATTHQQAFLAWSGGVVLTGMVDLLIHNLYRPLPLAKIILVRIAILLFLYLIYRQRVRSRGARQLLWIAINFLGFSVIVAYLGSLVDPVLELPFYVSTGFVIAGATVHYPSQAPFAFSFPTTVSTVFAISYLLFVGDFDSTGVFVLGVLLATAPFFSSFGSIRLDNSLRKAFELNQRLATEVDLTRESQARLANTIKSISDAVISLDSRGFVELSNPEAKQMLALTQSSQADSTIESLLKLVTEEGEPIEVQWDVEWESPAETYLSSPENKIPVQVTCHPTWDIDSNLTGSVLTIQNLSHVREREERRMSQVRLESLGVLAGGIAHDFNNVLTTIQGNISLAELDVSQNNPARESLLEASIALQKARDLANQLLTFSKGGEPVKSVLPIAPLLRETVDLYLKGTQVRSTLKLDEGITADIDPVQMGQVFQNIVINSVEALPGGGNIAIVMLTKDGQIQIRFSDDGPGIPNEISEKIFDPYFSTKRTGSGLGLATSYSIAKKHNGSLRLERGESPGTTLQLTLPLAYAPPEGPVNQPEATPETLRVLVMDDEPTVRKVTCRMLLHLGLEPVPTEDGAEALKEYRAAQEAGKPFAAVLMDLVVPEGMGGKEMLGHLLELDPNAKVVAASGYSSDQIMSRWHEHGLAGAIAKPFGLEQLKSLLEELELLADEEAAASIQES